MGNGLQKYGITRQLVSAAQYEPETSILACVEHHPELLAINHSRLGGTVWHYAAKRGKTDLLRLLIRFAATRVQNANQQQQQRHISLLLNQTYGLGDTPLLVACANGHVNAANMLLLHGADPYNTDRRGKKNCLHLAAAAGHTKVIEVILQTAATFPLLSEAQRPFRSIVAAAAAAAEEEEEEEEEEETEVRTQHANAARSNQPPTVAAAATQRAPQLQPPPGAALLDSRDIYGLTPLHLAICKQRHKAVAALLQAGASLSAANTMPVNEAVTLYMPRGTTPLHAAVRVGDTQIVLQLLACHMQRLGGTAAGSMEDPRGLSDEKRQLPWHVAKHMGRSVALCQLLDPTAALREQLQAAMPTAAGSTAPLGSTATAFTVTAADLSVSIPASVVQLKSLQEIAAVQLKQSLLAQAAAAAAATGVQFADLSDGELAQHAQHMQALCMRSETSADLNITGSTAVMMGCAGCCARECGVCFEETPVLLFGLQPCMHVLCADCYQMLVRLIACKPARCPFCRTAIAGCVVHDL